MKNTNIFLPVRNKIKISTKFSIIQDQIPVWDLFKMVIENINGKTWDNHNIDKKGQILRWTTIIFRSISLATKILIILEIIEKDITGIISNIALMCIFKGLGMVTYFWEQYRLNKTLLKNKINSII